MFVWVVGSCLAVSGHEVLPCWLGLMSKRLFVILYMVESLASAVLCSRRGPPSEWPGNTIVIVIAI